MRSKIDLQSSPVGGVICTLKPLPQAACDITKSVQRGTFTNIRRKSSTNENNETRVLLTYIVLCFFFQGEVQRFTLMIKRSIDPSGTVMIPPDSSPSMWERSRFVNFARVLEA